MRIKNNISVLIIFVLSIYASIVQAQVDTLWTKTFGGTGSDAGQSVQQTKDGGYIITGHTYSFGTGMADVWLIKTDSCGNTSWTKTFGGSNRDEGYSVKQTSDSGYIIVGSTKSFGSGDYDFWLIKTDADGDELWSKTFGGTGLDIGSSVQQTADGGYIMVGWTNSFGSGDYDFWLIKTDALGDSLWTKSFDCGNTTDYGVSAQQTIDEGYIITGDKFTFGIGYHDVLLIKTDSYGNTIWIKSYGGVDSETGRAVQQTSDGGYIITGGADSGIDLEDVWLIKTNTAGDTVWTKKFGGSGSDWGDFVQQIEDNGYIITGITTIAGYTTGDVWLIKSTPDTAIVPVELTSFTATSNGIEVMLNWSTATETNNSGFCIERKSNNSEYSEIGFVPSFGTTTEPKLYSFTDLKVTAVKYTYRLKQIDFDGSYEYSPEVEVEVSAPIAFSLEQSYPNPFNPTTTIGFGIENKSNVKITILNAIGEEVAVLLDEEIEAGFHQVEFNAANLPSGVYFYQLIAGSFVETKKMVLMK